MDCDSDYLVYLVTCKKCHGQYVGKSQTKFKLRHSNHKREIKGDIGGLGHHYNKAKGGCGYVNLAVIVEPIAIGRKFNLGVAQLCHMVPSSNMTRFQCLV